MVLGFGQYCVYTSGWHKIRTTGYNWRKKLLDEL